MVRNGPVRSEQVCDADDQNSSGCKEQNLGGVNSSKHGHFSSAPSPRHLRLQQRQNCVCQQNYCAKARSKRLAAPSILPTRIRDEL
jgi:hypothetical protein